MEKLHTPANLHSHSPSFQISYNPNNATSHEPLPLFGHTSLPKGGIAFIGGPVSSLSFHPTAPGICLTAAHNTTNPTHILHKCYEGPAVIQLWQFTISNNTPTTKCLGLIPHNGDSTFDLKWRPAVATKPTHNWNGTFAAALGDGSVIVCHLDADHIPTIDRSPEGSAPHLEPTTIVLRRNTARSPVRVVEWSPDGKRLVVGSANGNVEVYEADSHNACWPSWTIPAQESVISDIRWLSPQLYCTLGMSCVLRLCDVRDPIATLEQNCEGLQGSLSMAMLEPYVAVVGADSGYLRVVRLSAIDKVTAQNPVRRVYLQNSSFRDMRSVSLSDTTLLYTGGSEGILHQVVFPKPLWPMKGACKIEKTRMSEKLRWSLDADVMHLQLNPPSPKEKGKKKRHAIGRGANGPEGALFGERYKQPIVVTRITVNAQNNVIAVGIDGGFVTWLPINTASDSHAIPVVEEDAHMFSTTYASTNGHDRQPEEPNGNVIGLNPSSSVRNIPFKVKLKKEAKRPVYGPKRKRGRPRKVATDNAQKTGGEEKQTRDETDPKSDIADSPKSTARHTGVQQENVEAFAVAKTSLRIRKRGRAGNYNDTAAECPVEVVDELITYGKHKTRKRRRTRAPESSPEEEPAPEAKVAQPDQVLEETVTSQDITEDDVVEGTPHGTTPRTRARSGLSTKRSRMRSSLREQHAHDSMLIPLRLRIQKPAWEKLRSGKKNKLAGEPSQPSQPARKSARRSASSAKASFSDHPTKSDVSSQAEVPDAHLKPDSSLRISAISYPERTDQSTVGTPFDAPPTAPRQVRLIVRRREVSSADELPQVSTKPDASATSALNEERTSVPVRLCIRKRSVDEVTHPAVGHKRSPKRSKASLQVVDQVTHSSNVEESGEVPPEDAIQWQEATPARSRRLRKPSWRVRKD